MVLQHEFEEMGNDALAHLCGELDAHLKGIASALGVRLTRRQAKFRIEGPAAAARSALDVLQRLQALAHRPIAPETLQLLLVQAGAQPAAAPTAPTLTLHTRRHDLAARTPNQQAYLNRILSNDLSLGVGPAGTGKTYLAVACAVDALERHQVQRIVLTRPAVEAGERLGFLPGDLAQKVDPYLRPLFDALYDLMGFEKVNRAQEKGLLEVAPLAFMRGRTLNHAFVILDEAQNTTPEQMKMFLTRIGFGSRAVVTGDTSQVDLPRGVTSGLIDALQVLDGVEGIGLTRFTRADVVRHPLVGRIVEAYDRRAATTGGRP
ncbi:PhoH family protein [Inhella gelatinilytica]|uniref:PhoH-like protein n=1 Tax=Inhella gelatinilytica TaxID=2795030 RepID=A0A931J215_9BURK|nr:PhoH family protein [Inhella gelatinilytica]MBH9553906.1 PhoH family protein [Inhella gelatinilytica]